MENITLENGKNRGRKPEKQGLNPPQLLVIGFAGVILIGALLLTLPMATVDGQGASFLTALFTATSATCVTGLVVVDTGTYFTVFGQLVILLLIQIGGLGIMTFATLFAIILGRKITLKERILLQESLNQVSIEGIVRLAKYIMSITLTIEAAGAAILAIRWSQEFGWPKAIYFGIFHAVSAFNNAGFDIFGGFRSITMYVGDITVNLVIAGLIILGGLGFHVLSDVLVNRGHKLRLHTQIVLRTTAGLIILGSVVIFLLEYTNPATMAGLDPLSKVLASFFQAVTPRTAGYNTIPLGGLRDTTILFMVILMFIGASPGSTGGGIKTTTFVSVFLSVITSFRGKTTVSIRERTLPQDIIQKAMILTISALTLVVTITGLLSLTEHFSFLQLLFEVTSAFATVGLTTGITPNLSNYAKIMLILTMYTGRVGLLTLVFALVKRGKTQPDTIKYPEERIIIG